MRKPRSASRLFEAISPSARRLAIVIFSLGLGATAPLDKSTESQTCRQLSAAILEGDVDKATALLDPDPVDEAQSIENAARVASSLAGALKHMAPYLERTLPDLTVENHSASLQIWSFGDREVYFVGCLIRGDGRDRRFALEIRTSVDAVVQNLRAKVLSK